MAGLRITDLVDPKAIEQLKGLSDNLTSLKDDYAKTAKEIAKGLKLNVSVSGDLDKLNALILQKTKEADVTTTKLNETLKEQAAIIEKLKKALEDKMAVEKNTTNTISRELAEQEKLNAQHREEFNETSKWKQLADDVLGTRDANLIRLANTEKELKAVAEATKNLEKQEKAGQISSDEYTKKRAALIEQERTLKAAKSELTGILSNEEKTMQSAEGSYQRLSFELERMKKAYKQLSEEEKASPQGQAMAQSIQSYDARLKDLGADMGEFQRNVGNYAIAGTSLRTQMRQAIEEIASLEMQWRGMSAEEKSSAKGQEMKAHMDELTNKASELQDAIGDVKESVKNGADDTATFQAISQGANLIVSGFGAATGAAQLLGVSEDDLVEVQTKLQAALVISNGLTQIQTAVQKQSYVMKGIGAIQTKALAMAENLETAAKGKGVVATIALTAAQRVCNAVAKANPYVILATIILGVVAAVVGLTHANEDEAESEEEVKRKTEERAKAQKDFADSVSQSAGAQISAYMKLRREWNNLGNSLKAKQKFIENNKKAFNDLGYSVNTVSQAENLLVKGTNNVVGAIVARAKAFAYQDLITKAYTDLVNKQVELEQGAKYKRAKVGDRISSKEAKGLGSHAQYSSYHVGGSNVSSGNSDSYWTISDAEGASLVNSKRNEDAARDWMNKRKKIIDEANKKVSSYTDGLTNAAKEEESFFGASNVPLFTGDEGKANKGSKSDKNDKFKSEEELEQNLLKLKKESVDAKLGYVSKGSKQELDIRKELAQSQYDLDISEANKAQAQELSELESSYKNGAVTKDKYDAMKADIAQIYADKEVEIENKKQSSISAAESDYAEEQVNIVAKKYADMQQLRDMRYIEESNALENSYAKGLISEEQYNSDKMRLDSDYAKDTAEITFDSLKEQLNVANMSEEQRTKIKEELSNAQKDLAQAEANSEIEAIKSVTEADKQAKEKRIENAKEWLDRASEALSAIGDLSNAIFDGQIQNIEDEQDANDEAYDKDVERVENLVEQNVITEEEGEARKRSAQARTEAKNEELEKKKAEMQYKQAVLNKGIQLAQTGIATARGIMETIAKLGMPAAIPFVAFTAAMGAIQAATIIATPIPKYAKGTDDGGHKGGLALVGDGGRSELVTYAGHSWITPDTPTLVDMPKGAIVYPDADKAVMDMSFFPLARTNDSTNVVVNNDYSRLEKGLGKVCSLVEKQMKHSDRLSYMERYERYKASRL